MARVFLLVLALGVAWAAPQRQYQQQQGQQGQQGQQPQYQPQQPQGPPPQPHINWGRCPQLQPTDSEKNQKRQVIQECLQQYPPPEQVTQESAAQHHETIITCALVKEKWFLDDGRYNFDRAKQEIQGKGLGHNEQGSILEKHDTCRGEAQQKYSTDYVSQLKLYQSCMDYHIGEICGIQISLPEQAQQGGQQGYPPQQQQGQGYPQQGQRG